jgi:serine/threonine-protein kinase RsbT
MPEALGLNEEDRLHARVVDRVARFTDELSARGLVRRARADARIEQEAPLLRAALPRLLSSLAPLLHAHLGEAQAGEILGELESFVFTEHESLRRSFPLRDEHDARRARLSIRDLCLDAGADRMTALRVATATAELSRNVLAYATEGEIEVQVRAGRTSRVTVVVRDRGPGIRDVDRVLSGTFHSQTGMGRGLWATKRMADAFDLETGPSGTTVTFTLDL